MSPKPSILNNLRERSHIGLFMAEDLPCRATSISLPEPAHSATQVHSRSTRSIKCECKKYRINREKGDSVFWVIILVQSYVRKSSSHLSSSLIN
jgi:hypothetical protein